MKQHGDLINEMIFEFENCFKTECENISCMACGDTFSEKLSIDQKVYCMSCLLEIRFGILPMDNEPVNGAEGYPPKGVPRDDNPLYEKCKKNDLRDF